MLKITINKQPITHLVITEDLSCIKIYLNPHEKDEPHYRKRKFVIDLIRYKDPNGSSIPAVGYISVSGNEIILHSMKDIDMELGQLAIEFPGIKFDRWPVYSDFRSKGMSHAIEYPIKQLFNQGFLNEEQFKQINEYIKKQVTVLQISLQRSAAPLPPSSASCLVAQSSLFNKTKNKDDKNKTPVSPQLPPEISQQPENEMLPEFYTIQSKL